jgi:two-component system sensor histidine kinase KdpD
VLIDASPETLRDRLRAGKIYPKERVDAALSSFFQTDNLLALRELAVREAMRVRRTSKNTRVGDLMLGVAQRERDVGLIRRGARLANRLGVDLHVVHVARPRAARDGGVLAALESAARSAGASWAIAVSEHLPRELARRALVAKAVVIVEGAREKPRLLGGATFARRVLEAGAVEVLVLAP